MTLIYLIFIFALPYLVTLGPFLGFHGIVLAIGLGAVSFIIVHSISERRVLNIIRSKLGSLNLSDFEAHSNILKKSLNEVLLSYADTLDINKRASFLRTPPRIEILPSPHLSLWVFRSAWSRGTIAMSRGLLQTLDELSLRNHLFISLQRLYAPSTVFQTTYAYLLEKFRTLGSVEFHELVWSKSQKDVDYSRLSQTDLTPLGVLVFLITSPIQRRLVKSLSAHNESGVIKGINYKRNCDLLLNELNLIGNYE